MFIGIEYRANWSHISWEISVNQDIRSLSISNFIYLKKNS
jgi:hypothetical protein